MLQPLGDAVADAGGFKVDVVAYGDVLTDREFSPVMVKALAICGTHRPYVIEVEDLHELDQAAAERIVVASPPDGPEWAAVHDRLRRARAGSVARQ